VKAFVVVDLAFGDSGKGGITDFLVREHKAGLVVRWNGGAQAGHNVVTADGLHHTFSQFGAGTFAGARTHLSEDVVIHPTALLVEARRLEAKGVADPLSRLTIAESARVVTPFHQAAGRIRELATRHGSCGVGVGEAVRDGLEHAGDALRARDLLGDCRAKLARIQERLRTVPDVDDPRAKAERAVLDDARIIDRWLDAIAPMLRCIAPDAISLEGSVVLEGAHGVLLDEWRGFHPHTTWHTCTSDAALDWLKRRGFEGDVTRLGVLRTYLTRHGAGPFPTEAALPFKEPHNDASGWQGAFRTGWPDLMLVKYAIAISPVDGIALTHCDRRTDWRTATRYESMNRILPGKRGDLAHQERLTKELLAARPVYEAASLNDLLPRPILIDSWGPAAEDKRGFSLP
jgi:adenylosuccinate synthase